MAYQTPLHATSTPDAPYKSLARATEALKRDGRWPPPRNCASGRSVPRQWPRPRTDSSSQICNIYDMLSDLGGRHVACCHALAAVLFAALPSLLLAAAEHEGPAAQQAARDIKRLAIEPTPPRRACSARVGARRAGRRDRRHRSGRCRVGRPGWPDARLVGAAGSPAIHARRHRWESAVHAGRADQRSRRLTSTPASPTTAPSRAWMTIAIEELEGRTPTAKDSGPRKWRLARELRVAQVRGRGRGRRTAEVEQQLLADAAVQHELERLRRGTERERQEQEAAAAAAARSGTGERSPGGLEQRRERPRARTGDSGGGGDSGGPGESESPAPTPEPPPPPRPNMICPVAGATAFSDTWGAPRSGGRSHQGVDMMSPTGTPLVAVASNTAQFKTNSLGGNAIWLSANDGTSTTTPTSARGKVRKVAQCRKGKSSDTSGPTGNTTVAHLHFEVHRA